MTPRRFAVVGDPIAHSKSPAMHMAALSTLGLPHRYEALRAAGDELAQVVMLLRQGMYDGLNVTVPHKQRVLALVDELDDSARLAGAANTLLRRDDGRIVAYNTDAPALAAELTRIAESEARWEGMRALVLGSGGAARAAIAALGAHLGVRDVVVRARSFADPSKAAAFRDSAPCPVTTQPWHAERASEERTLAIIQATSAGMRGADPGDDVAAVVEWSALPKAAVAIDVVYAPRDTPWLRAARAHGLRSDDGLGMLARQGALAFELWLGVKAPLAAMRAALE